MSPKKDTPKRGEIWWADLEPVKGHEQGGRRPCLVVSVDEFNQLPHGLVWTVPITSNVRFRHAFAVAVQAPDGGLKVESLILCHQLRTLSTERLAKRAGVLPDDLFDEVKKRIALALDF